MTREIAQDNLIRILNNEILPFSIKDKLTYHPLIEKIGDARIVLIGEASHGTEEFYQSRIELSKYLIEEKGFHAITIEGDWPNAHSIHRYLQGMNNANDSDACLKQFKRFPTWMCCNSTIPPFLKWLRHYNDQLKDVKQ